jgi:molecular chaperone GrpE
MKHEKNQDLKKALELLATIEDKKNNPAKETTESEATVDYRAVVEKEFDDLNSVITRLEEQNLENVAKIQTMARRHAEENLKTLKYGGMKLAEELLKPIDLLKKVVSTPVENPELKNYLMGFEMIIRQLDQGLTDNGITQIPVQVGDEFDPILHNANESVATDVVKSGQIAAVIANGYKMHDRVIIHALVKVAK